MSLIWRPFTQMQKAPPTPTVLKAKNTNLFLKNNKKVIDAISSWWVITHGHCKTEIVKAVQKTAKDLDQVLFANFSHEKAEKLIKELSKFLPKNLNKFFFSDNGSTAIEVALKIAVQSFSQKGQAQKKEFLSFKNSYHGDTAGAMSVSARGVFTKAYKRFLFPIHSCSQGQLSTDPDKMFYEDFERKIEKHHKKLCAVIIEPLIQGAGGMIIWPPAVLERICRIAKAEGLYLIFDEIMTGFGRTGTLFAMDQIKTKPDILCLSKGLTGGFLPLALTISTDNIYKDFLSQKKEKALLHGHSFTGNPLSCSAALANLKLIQKNKFKLKNKWAWIEETNKQRLAHFKKHPKVKDVRAKGVIAVIQKESAYESFFAEQASQKALRQGVFLRPLGGTLYILPPYCITKKELHKVWDVIESLF
ncbi:MAG: adenosylmethionine--8-amino-7-oxononanoate transaminase [Bdellovibrionaceae bacterium]|nr:adenosylmethionine--8-amino-7-oxononanoate transaminase [Pseudobdellovibrionaceae bacterium]